MQDWGHWYFKPLIVCFMHWSLNVSYDVKTRNYFLNCFIYISKNNLDSNVPSCCDCSYMCLKQLVLIILLQERIKRNCTNLKCCMWGVHQISFRFREAEQQKKKWSKSTYSPSLMKSTGSCNISQICTTAWWSPQITEQTLSIKSPLFVKLDQGCQKWLNDILNVTVKLQLWWVF